MDELEKRRFRGLKTECVEWLKGVEWSEYDYALRGTDKRIGKYVDGCLADVEAHNLFELLAIKQFIIKLRRYEWREKQVRKFFVFYESLRFSGVKGRQHYKLTPVQCFQFANIFGFYRADGRRLTTDVLLFVPRKYGKTTSSASLAVYDLLFGDRNAQSYVCANDFNQAKICFDEIRNIVMDFDPQMSCFKVNREKIFCKLPQRETTATCLTANAKTKDGLNASLVVMDEYSQAKTSELKGTLVSSMGARENPLVVTITTASDMFNGPFYNELEAVKKVLLGEAENDGLFAHLFMPDVDDGENDPKTWTKVQPHMGITVKSDYYKQYYMRAQNNADEMLTFRTKLLNQFVSNERVAWMSQEKAQSLLEDFSFEHLSNRPQCMCAFDLSVKDDFSAVAYTCYDRPTKKFYSEVYYYFPSGQLEKHPNRELYKRWVEDGHLILCEGDCIDYQQIGNDIIEKSKKLRILQIGYDAYKAPDLVAMLTAMGGRNALKPFPQTHGAFNMPVESFELMAHHSPPQIALNNNPINAYCLANAVVDEDRLGNRKIVKPSLNRKIDGAICVLMTIGMFNRN